MSEPIRTTFEELVKAGCLTFGDGYRTKRSELGQPGLPILRVAEVLDGRISPAYQDYVHESYRASMCVKISKAGDVILTTKGTVGRVAIVPPDLPEFVYSPQLCYFRVPFDSPIESRYLYYWFKSDQFWSQATSRKSQTDMADYLNLGDIRSLQIRIPSRESQYQVVDILGALDDKIAVNDRIATTYESILRLSFASLGIDVEPDGGSGIALRDLVDLNPSTPSPQDADAVYLDMAAVPTRAARVQGWTRRPPKSGARFQNGDTVMARITPCLENGKTAFIDFMAEGEVGIGSTEFIVLRARDGVSESLPYFLARSPRFRSYAIQNMVGSSGRQRVSATALMDYELNRPNADALARFTEAASAALAHMKSLDAESHDLKDLRDGLLPGLMSGEIRVRDAEKVVEDMT